MRTNSVHLSNGRSELRNLVGSSILVKNTLCRSLVSALNSSANVLDYGLNAGLDSLVRLGLLIAGENSLLGRFDVCHVKYLHIKHA